jgi:hypothetical protein
LITKETKYAQVCKCVVNYLDIPPPELGQEFYMKLRTIHLFLGPVCDLAVIPVAKQTLFWNIPMVTVGAVDDEFMLKKREDYPLLTRAGPFTLQNLSQFFYKLLAQFRWRNVKIVHDTFADLGIFSFLSYQMGKAIYENLYSRNNFYNLPLNKSPISSRTFITYH